ncbi:hypothetical protein OF83DRAFT_1040786, partial [Amylostereum chailletii]
MNPAPTYPPEFNHIRLQANKLRIALPARPSGAAPIDAVFERAWTAEELGWAKNHIKDRGAKSATGLDGISYMHIMSIDNDALLLLPLNDAQSYRTIGLESCVLKLLTLLIHKRVYDWAEEQRIIPPSQNGFREGYRTNNNALILRCLIDRARAEGLPLYAAFVDISN